MAKVTAPMTGNPSLVMWAKRASRWPARARVSLPPTVLWGCRELEVA